MLFMMVVGGGAAVVLLMMVVAGCVVDDWQVVGCLGLNGGYVGRKIWFCISYKTHNGNDIHESISFMIDNMHYVILGI